MSPQSDSETADGEFGASEVVVDSKHNRPDKPGTFEVLAREQDRSIFWFSATLVAVQFVLVVCITPVATIVSELCRSQGIDHEIDLLAVMGNPGPLKLILIVGIIGPLIETFLFQFAVIEPLRVFIPKRVWIQFAVAAGVFCLAHFFNSVVAGMTAGGAGGVVLAAAYLAGRQRSFWRAFLGTFLTHAIWNCMLTGLVLMVRNQGG